MGKSLRVLDNGSWSTVEIPHILNDGIWEKTFKTHVVSGGVWKESHKTLYSNYSIGTGGQPETSTDGSWTVPAKTRYIRVKIWGSSGSGGGGNASWPYYETGSTQYPLNPVFQSRAVGGPGGDGGYAEVVLETKPGVTFSWTGFSSTPHLTGGTGSENLPGYYGTDTPSTGMRLVKPHTYEGWAAYTTHASDNTKGAWHAGHGADAPNIIFTGDSPTSGDPYIITAEGGRKGYGGVMWVTAGYKTGGYLVTGVHYYTFSVSYGRDFAQGNNTSANPANSYASFTETGALDFWDLSTYASGTYPGIATASGNGSSFAASTLTSGAGMSGGSGGGVPLEADGPVGYNAYYGKNGDPGVTGKLIIDTYQ